MQEIKQVKYNPSLSVTLHVNLRHLDLVSHILIKN
jgi:hypothetical protein